MVTLWLPTASDAMFSVAWPEASSAALPRFVAPSKKVTVALGVPVAGATAVTVAVSVMLCPDTDGLVEDTKLVDDEAWLTVCVNVVLLLGLKLPSPLYLIVTLWLPTACAALFSAAWPEASSAPLPRLVAPSKKVTVAVGIPAAGATAVTVAVSVMLCPDTDGLSEDTKPAADDTSF